MKVIGGILIVLALVVSIVPQFTDCQSQGKSIALPNGNTIAMKCHWSARAELATGVPVLFLGAMMTVSQDRRRWQTLAILGIVLGAAVVLVPTYLIGVCANPDMICSMIMKPLLIFGGALIAAASIVALVASRDKGSEALSV